MKLEPNHLLQIADALGSEVHPTRDGQTYICTTASDLGFDRGAIERLMLECGIESLFGCLFPFEWHGPESDRYYNQNAMPVRFMFLEFMAHYLEDQS